MSEYTRNYQIILQVLQGDSYAKVGKKHDISSMWVRQIFIKAIRELAQNKNMHLDFPGQYLVWFPTLYEIRKQADIWLYLFDVYYPHKLKYGYRSQIPNWRSKHMWWITAHVKHSLQQRKLENK